MDDILKLSGKPLLLWVILTLGISLFPGLAVNAQGAYIVTGVVRDVTAKPVAGAAVALTARAQSYGARTDVSGRFSIAVPERTNYTLTVAARGFAPFSRTVEVARSLDAGSVVLKAVPPPLKIIGSVVTHERLPFNVTPVSVKVFPRESYRDQGQAALSTIFDQTAGVVVEQLPGTNTAQPLAPYGVSIRGGAPYGTAFLIDGNAVSLPGSGAFNAAYVPSFVLQDVEVIRGASSAETTMSGAVDGAVNARTADPGVTMRGMLEFERDTRNWQFSDFSFGGPVNKNLSFTSMFSFDGNSGPALERAQLLKARYNAGPNTTATVTYLGSQGYVGDAFYAGPASHAHAMNLTSFDIHSDAGRDHYTAKFFELQLQQDNAVDPFADPRFVSGVSLQDDRDAGSTTLQVQGSYRHGFTGTLSREEAMLRVAALTHASADLDTQVSAAADWLDGVLTPVVHAGAAYHVQPQLTVRGSVGNGIALDPFGTFDNAPTADAGLEYRLHGETTTLSADAYDTGGLYHHDGLELAIQQFKRAGLGYIAQFTERGGLRDPAFPVSSSQGYGEISYKWPRGSRLSFGALYVGSGSIYQPGAFVQLNSNLELSLGNVSKLQLSVENPTHVGNRIPFGIRMMFREALGGPILEK